MPKLTRDRHPLKSALMRLTIVLASAALKGCSGGAIYVPPTILAPDQNSAIKGAKKGANEAKLVGAIEISTVREAHPLGPGRYILCIKGTNAVTGTRLYAVFFNNNDFVAIRSSVIIDDCERQVFGPLGIGPFPDEAQKARTD